MPAKLTVTVEGFADGAPIPGEFAFCVPAAEGHVALAPNKNPAISWAGAPEGTVAYAIVCCDPDVPSVGDDVNQEGRTVPAGLPRVDFYHWVLVNIPADRTGFAAGEVCDGVTAKGKPTGAVAHGVRGYNDYTGWFAGDPDMAGDYGGYDGPCPPWNDARLHHYVFTVYALDATLSLPARFGGAEALKAMEGHVLAQGSHTGTYTLNPALR